MAFTAALNSRLDDDIFFSKNSKATASADPYLFNHLIQWSTNATPASGSSLQLWVGYNGWDTQTAAQASGATNILTIQSVQTFGASLPPTQATNYWCGIDFSTATTIPSTNANNRCGASITSATVPVTAAWTASTATTSARSLLTHTQTFLGDPVIKVGQTVAYKAGFVWQASSSATAVRGTSALQSWVIVDGATALVMTGVAAAIATLTF